MYWEDKDLSVIGSGSTETIIDAMQTTNGAVILNVSQESIFKGFTLMFITLPPMAVY